MSFILDALKKSESDRQRQTGPALYEVRVAPPRAGLPLWAVAIAALLAVNLGIVLWMLLRSNARDAAAVQPAAPAATAPAAAAAAVAAAPLAAPAAAPVAAASPAPVMTAPPAAMPAPAPTLSQAPASEPAVGAQEPQNPQDFAPAQESSSPGSMHVRRTSAAGVPLYQDAAATPGTQIPQLHLDFHMYAPQPQDRFVMINMHKLREGESLPEGVHVNSITPEGAVLSYNGQTFMLPRE